MPRDEELQAFEPPAFVRFNIEANAPVPYIGRTAICGEPIDAGAMVRFDRSDNNAVIRTHTGAPAQQVEAECDGVALNSTHARGQPIQVGGSGDYQIYDSSSIRTARGDILVAHLFGNVQVYAAIAGIADRWITFVGSLANEWVFRFEPRVTNQRVTMAP